MNTFEPFPSIARLSREAIITEKIDGTNAQVFIWDENAEVPVPCGDATLGTMSKTAGPPPVDIPFLDHWTYETGGVFSRRHVAAGSRNRWLTLKEDNHGFAHWVRDHSYHLCLIGHGRHFGEWWGCGIQRGYGVPDKRFSLFNVSRWDQHLFEQNEELKQCRSNPAARPERKVFVPPPACCSVVPILATGTFGSFNIDVVMDGLANNGSYAAPGFMRPEGIVIYHTAARVFFKKTFEKDAEGKGGAAATRAGSPRSSSTWPRRSRCSVTVGPTNHENPTALHQAPSLPRDPPPNLTFSSPAELRGCL